jgi:hypothetical protein
MRFGKCEDCDKPHRPNPARQPRDTECRCDYIAPAHKSGPAQPTPAAVQQAVVEHFLGTPLLEVRIKGDAPVIAVARTELDRLRDVEIASRRLLQSRTDIEVNFQALRSALKGQE